jgi:hypothetical protein
VDGRILLKLISEKEDGGLSRLKLVVYVRSKLCKNAPAEDLLHSIYMVYNRGVRRIPHFSKLFLGAKWAAAKGPLGNEHRYHALKSSQTIKAVLGVM